jgi:hypothetical protein
MAIEEIIGGIFEIEYKIMRDFGENKLDELKKEYNQQNSLLRDRVKEYSGEIIDKFIERRDLLKKLTRDYLGGFGASKEYFDKLKNICEEQKEKIEEYLTKNEN